jgi:hypothetical protein
VAAAMMQFTHGIPGTSSPNTGPPHLQQIPVAFGSERLFSAASFMVLLSTARTGPILGERIDGLLRVQPHPKEL